MKRNNWCSETPPNRLWSSKVLSVYSSIWKAGTVPLVTFNMRMFQWHHFVACEYYRLVIIEIIIISTCSQFTPHLEENVVLNIQCIGLQKSFNRKYILDFNHSTARLVQSSNDMHHMKSIFTWWRVSSSFVSNSIFWCSFRTFSYKFFMGEPSMTQ
jgi:hypothetical protein